MTGCCFFQIPFLITPLSDLSLFVGEKDWENDQRVSDKVNKVQKAEICSSSMTF